MRTDILTKNSQGEILMPKQFDYIMSQPYIRHAQPTKHAGFYHRHRLNAATDWNLKLAIDDFWENLRYTPGLQIMWRSEIKRYPGSGAFSHVAELLYAVDGPMPPGAKGNRLHDSLLYPFC